MCVDGWLGSELCLTLTSEALSGHSIGSTFSGNWELMSVLGVFKC